MTSVSCVVFHAGTQQERLILAVEFIGNLANAPVFLRFDVGLRKLLRESNFGKANVADRDGIRLSGFEVPLLA